MRKQTRVSWLPTRYCFSKIGTREDIFTRRSRASTLQIISTRLSNNESMTTFASDTSLLRHTFYLVKGLARKVWRQCVLVFAHDLGFRGGKLHRFPCEHWGFFLSIGNSPFGLFTTAPDSILPCLASKFRIRSFWSLHLFTMAFNFLIVGNRFLLMILHVVQFQCSFELRRLTYP